MPVTPVPSNLRFALARHVESYGVDHVAVAEGLGCKAIRVKSPNEFKDAFAKAQALMEEKP